MTPLPRHRVLALLAECSGDEIWSIEYCRNRRIPEAWIVELSDGHESGFKSDSETIYTDQGVTNQYEGIRDIDLAVRLAQSMNIRVTQNDTARFSRARLVQAIKDAVMNGDDEL